MKGHHYCMPRGIFLILVFLLLSAWPAFAENRALIIGVGKYQIEANNLPGIDKDVEMARKIALIIGFKPKQIKVVMDEQATLKNIGASVNNWLIKGTTKNDRVFFYYSGHGAQIPDTGRDEDDKADEVLVPHDIKVTNGTLENAFLDDVFGKMLAKIPARESFVFIDACHSGTSTKSILDTDQKAKVFIYPGMPHQIPKAFSAQPRRRAVTRERFASLSACRDDEVARATPEGSLFTLALYNAIVNGQGKPVTFKLLQESTTDFIASHLSAGKAHHPVLTGSKKLQNKNILVREVESSSAEPSLFDQWMLLPEKADYEVPIQTNQSRFKQGELLEISLKMPHDGYVNVFNLSPGDKKLTVLFPNGYHKQNFFEAGSRVAIPDRSDSFTLPASPPFGKSLIVVVVTTQNINAYSKGIGNSGDLFKLMSNETTGEVEHAFRNFDPQPKSTGLGAGRVIALIEQ
ncbi:caspase family protein [Desulfobacter curvatus]|uniref:caspase family protein n=1 Tax=Desulfobacter curvatus TaxID=2290 RepID=UPI00037542B0|nr:caspase family protein [Desulfobacter curvatus]